MPMVAIRAEVKATTSVHSHWNQLPPDSDPSQHRVFSRQASVLSSHLPHFVAALDGDTPS